MTTALEGLSRPVLIGSIVLSILLIIFGVMAIALPVATSVGFALMLGWLVLFGGIVQLIHSFQSKGIGHIAWKLLVSIFYLAVGVYLIGHPALGLAGLTLALAMFFFAQGVVDIIAYFSTRKSGGSPWMLLNGVITLVLGWMIANRWPASSLWFVGVLVGIGMLTAGTTRLMMTLALHKLLQQHPDSTPSRERWAA